jgi:hypothetical protein
VTLYRTTTQLPLLCLCHAVPPLPYTAITLPFSCCPSLALHPRHAVPLMLSLPRPTPRHAVPACTTCCPSHPVPPFPYTHACHAVPLTLSLSCPYMLSLPRRPSLALHTPSSRCPSLVLHHPRCPSLASRELLWTIVSVIRPLSHTLCIIAKHIMTSLSC